MMIDPDPMVPGGNRERISKWADFVYTRRGGVTHVRAFTPTIYSDRPVLCGRELPWGEDWLGTGNQAEIDRARRMPLCIRCMNLSRDRNA